MNVGVCRVRLRLPENHSLKGKRQGGKSVTQRVRNKYDVSIAEVDDQDAWQVVTLGISCVSESAQHANEILSKVVGFIENTRFDVEMLDYDLEIINF